MAPGEEDSEAGTTRWSTTKPRPILPAVGRREPPPQSPQDPPGPLSAVACDLCRKRKTKCGRTLPRCSLCVSRNLQCVYQQPSAERDEMARRQLDDYQELFSYIRTKPDAREVDDIVRRIRSGRPTAEIVRQIRDGNLLLQMSLVPDARFSYTFPYISEMPYYLLNENNSDGHNSNDNPYLRSPMFTNDSPSLSATSSSESAASSSTTLSAGPNALRPPLQAMYVKPYHTAELVEPILETIQPSAWTCVSNNDDLMVELLRIYLLSQYPFYPHFHKDHFLRSMNQRRRRRSDGDKGKGLSSNKDNDDRDDEIGGGNHAATRYCSPLLLNSVLAVACHGMRVKSPREAKELGDKFLHEAMALWNEEDSEEQRGEDNGGKFAPASPLTRIQAGMVLFLAHFIDGSDTIGWRYLAEAAQIARDMRLMEDEYGPRLKNNMLPLQEEKAVRLFTAWSLYGWQGLLCFHFHRTPLIESPPNTPLPDAFRNSEWYGEVLVRYPGEGELTPSHFGPTLQCMTKLRSIITDIAGMLFGPEEEKQRDSSDESTGADDDEEMITSSSGSSRRSEPIVDAALIFGFFIRLQEWWKTLPVQLKPNRIALPSQLKMHMHYHNIIIRLMQPAGDILLSPHADSSRQSRLHEKEAAGTAHRIVAHSKKELETLVRLYFLRHGPSLYDPLITPFYSSLGFYLLDTLREAPVSWQPSSTALSSSNNSPDPREILIRHLRSTLVLVVQALHRQGQQGNLASRVALLLHSMLREVDEEGADIVVKYSGLILAGNDEDSGDQAGSSDEIRSQIRQRMETCPPHDGTTDVGEESLEATRRRDSPTKDGEGSLWPVNVLSITDSAKGRRLQDMVKRAFESGAL